MNEPRRTDGLPDDTRSITMIEPVPALRLRPDAGGESAWPPPDERGAARRRTFYSDAEAGPGQVRQVVGLVGPLLPGPDAPWRFSVGLAVHTEDGGWGARTVGYGDVAGEDEAVKAATDMAFGFLDNPVIPAEPDPVPVIVTTEQTQLDFIRRGMGTVREFAEHVHDESYAMDESMRATLARLADDMQWLIDSFEEATAWGAEHAHELERLQSLLASGDAADGHHTHNDLYEHRMLLHAHLAQRWYAEGTPVVKSWRHHDGEKCYGGGWFIVVMELPTGQVSYHYPAGAWDLFHVPEQQIAPVWDGHSAQDAARRMREAISLFGSNPKLMQRRCTNSHPHDPHYYTVSLVCWCASQRPNLEQS